MTVPVIPGVVRTVTKTVPGIKISRADTPIRSQNVHAGIDRLTVLALLGVCLIADGGALFLCGFLFGGH